MHRRTFIAAGAASAAPLPALAKVPNLENPDLVRLSRELPVAVTRYQDAQKTVADIEARWMPDWPAPDESIIRYGSGCEDHRDIVGRGIPVTRTGNLKVGMIGVPQIGLPETFEASAASYRREADRLSKTRSKRGMKQRIRWAEMDEARIEPARAYWAKRDLIVKASGITPALKEQTDARDALHTLVGAIMCTVEWSARGVVIKADALKAWSHVEPIYLLMNPDQPKWVSLMADAVYRQA